VISEMPESKNSDINPDMVRFTKPTIFIRSVILRITIPVMDGTMSTIYCKESTTSSMASKVASLITEIKLVALLAVSFTMVLAMLTPSMEALMEILRTLFVYVVNCLLVDLTVFIAIIGATIIANKYRPIIPIKINPITSTLREMLLFMGARIIFVMVNVEL
jgi:hypothetical protein